MRTALCLAILLFVLPALASDVKPDAPPSPPPVTYEVWGFQWDGQQYVKQATHSLHALPTSSRPWITRPRSTASPVGRRQRTCLTLRRPHRLPRSLSYHRPAVRLPRQTDLHRLGLHADRRKMGQGREVLLDDPRSASRPGVREESQRRSRLVRDDQLPRTRAAGATICRWRHAPRRTSQQLTTLATACKRA